MGKVTRESGEKIEIEEVGSVSAEEQIRLIKKLQKNTITKAEERILMGSVHKLIISVAKGFKVSLPDRSLGDLVQDGAANVWLLLKTIYQEWRHNKKGDLVRVLPSTFIHMVLRTGFSKEIKKLKSRSAKQIICRKDNEGNEELMEANLPNMSLQNFMDDDGNEYEPDIIGHMDRNHTEMMDKIYFDEMMVNLYQSVCRNLKEYRILNILMNVKKLPNVGTGRNRKCIEAIAQRLDVNKNMVKRLTQRVQPWLEKHDFIPRILAADIIPPRPEDVFDEKEMSRILEEEVVDIWDVIRNN